ncbi:NAD(P)/FAD-dependent oxidoreductase [Arthrobacter alpinus]|nr:NAD(P)/FAD-dependent oxidoreductase [Arthrobacter alpinus]
MHGYLSRDGLAPAQLLSLGRDEVEGYGGEIIAGTVTELVPSGSTGFWVLLTDGQRIFARRLLVATGLRDVLPSIPGLADRWARDVLHCPYCHGYEVRDQELGVLGGSPETVRYAQIVRQWAKDVVLFVPAGYLTNLQRSELIARSIGLVEGEVRRILTEDDHLKASKWTTAASFRGRRCSCRRASFPTMTFWSASAVHWMKPDGLLKDGTGQTTVPGVWIAGNVANPAPR